MRKAGENQRSWKGRAEKVVEPARHRWQMEGAGATGHVNAPNRSLSRILVFLLLLSFGMLSAFVYLLLHAPIKTPLITVGTTSYVWPMSPNSWVKEDVNGLASLHGKAIHWRDSSKAWQTKSTCLEDLRTQLRESAALAKRAGAIVLYINMHGAVNEEGEACVVPPVASCLATTQWIKVDELASTIVANTPPGIKVLLAFDCVHQQTNWNVAQLNNTFVDRLEEWASKSCPESVVVLSSCSPDQRAWAGAELHGSIFGRELRLGLAGEADRRTTPTHPGTGNGDGEVSMQELSDYLASTVDTWARAQRGVSQSPRVVSKSFSDFRVTWALKSWELARQTASVQHAELAASQPTSAEIDELWRSLDELRGMALYRFDPKGWAEIEQKLLWLDQLSNSGAGYSELASKQVYPSLSKRIKETLERAKTSIESENQIAKVNIIQERTETVEVPSHLPSLALQEYLGEINLDSANALRAQIVNAVLDNDLNVPSIVASLGFAPQVSQISELNFLGLAKKYDCVSRWPNQSVVQELFQLRDQCERFAIQGDVRGHRWRRPDLSFTDKARRKAEDQLILGPVDSLLIEASDSPWNEFRTALSQLDSGSDGTSARIEKALRLRDQGLAEVVYLAKWICSPETIFDNLAHWNKTDADQGGMLDANQLPSVIQDETSSYVREELAVQELKRLIRGLHQLSDLLSSVSEQGVGRREQLDELVIQVDRDLSSLKRLVRDHVERAGRKTAVAANIVREVDALLALPFLALEDRVSLRKTLQQKLREPAPISKAQSLPFEGTAGDAIRNRLANLQAKATADGSLNTSTLTKQTRYADRIRNWGTHPLGELILLQDGLSLETFSSLADSKANDKERELIAIDIGNSRLRRCYQSMQLFSESHVEDWVQSAGVTQTFDAGSSGWLKAAFTEQFERAIVPLCPIQFDVNSALAYRRLAFKDLLYWYANRVTDDFYADANSNSNAVNRPESYFERSVQQVLDYATRIQAGSSSMAETAQAIKEKAQALGPIARNGIRTSVKLGAPGADADRMRYEVIVMPSIVGAGAGKEWKLPIPEGLGSLLVRNSQGIMKEGRIGVAMPISGEQTSYNISSQPVDSTESQESVLVYRGHEFRAPMSLGQGIVVDFKPSHPDWAELVLFGDTKRQASIVFILDCSWSMGDKIPVEAIAMTSQSKLELAKESILRMITQIASRPDARVGVRLFGHRLGWSRPTDAKSGASSGKTQILVQPNYPDSIPNDLVPSRDVESILPLGRFTTDMVGGVANKLSKIVPWGQSPLYLSIIESFRDFDADDESTAKSIVVITDGDNFQFNASGRPGGEPTTITSVDGVYRAWNNSKVPLFILGVGVSDSQNTKARQNLLELAERTNGKYYDIENGSDLLRALSEQLSLETYEVSKVESRSINKSLVIVGGAKLNSPVELARVSSESYDVSFQSISKSVQFQGGESLELFVSDDGQDIVSKPYDRSSPRAATLVRTGENGRLIARVHRPSQRKNGVNFPISIQDPDSHFTPRPIQLWIEVTPVATNAESPRQTYYFYDANYEPKTPVPLVSWTATNWPASATAADVRVWAKYEPTPNLQTIAFEQVKQNLQRYSEGIAVNGVDGVKLSINLVTNRDDSNGFAIQITELHSDRSKGVGSLRVGLESDDAIVPSRVTRRFEPANNMAIHTFEFEATNGEAFLESGRSRVTIQTRVAAHEGAWQVQAGQPIRVDVNSVPESLPHAKLPPPLATR